MRRGWVLVWILVAVRPAWGGDAAAVSSDDGVVLWSLASCCGERSWEEAERAVAAELRSMEVDVQVVAAGPGAADAGKEELAAVARGAGARLALRFVRESSHLYRVDVVFVDARRGAQRRILYFRPLERAAGVRTAVLRVVEIARALLVLPQVTVAPKPARPAPRARRDRLTAAVGGMAVFGPGGGVPPGAAVHVVAGGQVGRRSWWALGGHQTAFRRDLRFEGDRASFSVGAVYAAWLWDVLQRPVWRFQLGPMGGWMWVRSDGISDDAAVRTRQDRDAVGHAGLLVRSAWRLSPVVAWVIEGRVEWLFPRVRVEMRGESVAVFGRPMVAAGAGLSFRIF